MSEKFTMYMSTSATYGKIYFSGKQPHWSQGRMLAEEFIREHYSDGYAARYLTGSVAMRQATYSIIYMGKGKPNLGHRVNLKKEVQL